MGKVVAEADFYEIIEFAQSVELRSLNWFGQLFPPSVPAFLLVVPPRKKSSTQVGLREIQCKNPCQGLGSRRIKINRNEHVILSLSKEAH